MSQYEIDYYFLCKEVYIKNWKTKLMAFQTAGTIAYLNESARLKKFEKKVYETVWERLHI